MPSKLELGSKGKLVELLQELLNRTLRPAKPLPVNGEFDRATEEAVQVFQKKRGLKSERDGDVGPETADALFKQVGHSADPIVKEVGEPAKPDKKKQGKPAPYNSGNYHILIPEWTGTFPLVVLFAGKHGLGRIWFKGQTPPEYWRQAIVIFSEWTGNYKEAIGQLGRLAPVKQGDVKVDGSRASICGWSAGGQPALAAAGSANALGLIDPVVNIAQVKGLGTAILEFNRKTWSVNKSDLPVKIALDYAVDHHIGKERPDIAHSDFPKYFLAKYQSKLI